MADSAKRRRTMKSPELIHILLIIHVLHNLCPLAASVEIHSQAFIQTDNELRYMVDSISLERKNTINNHNSKQNTLHGEDLIRFDPPLLDFHEQPLGMPQSQVVNIVHHPDAERPLTLYSIFGRTPPFHCSFFQDKVLLPGANTTFEVVFLARELGNVEDTLLIHSSLGSFKYSVFGRGRANPYRIRPFLGAKLPVNASFSPLIYLHNPHSSTLQVQEVYTSGGDLHLELPSGEKEASQELWEIPPFETKAIMKASFVGRTERNHTAFIRIRTATDDLLVLPVEVEVSPHPGIYSPLEMLDFGLLRSQDVSRVLNLNLLNSGAHSIHIVNISVVPANPAVAIDFRPVLLQPSVLQPIPVARISFNASKVLNAKFCSGKILVQTGTSRYKFSIAYQASVLQGSLEFDPDATLFLTSSQLKNMSRDFPVTNRFNLSLVIYNFTLADQVKPWLSVSNFEQTLVPAGHTVNLLQLHFRPSTAHLQLRSSLLLHTNASTFHVHIHIYNGRLRVIHHRPEIFRGQLDFGTLGVEAQRAMSFTLRNENPVQVVIKDFSSNMMLTSVHLLGVEAGNGTALTSNAQHPNADEEVVLRPHHYAVFSVDLIAPNYEGTFAAEVIITTQYENLYIPLTLRTAEGSLTSIPEVVVFEKCFPGKICSQDFKVHSSFGHFMEVRSLQFQPNDPRFYFNPPKEKPILIEPNQDTTLGSLAFNPKKECSDDCYLGLMTSSPAGHHWLVGLGLDPDVANSDQYLFTRYTQQWQQLQQSQLHQVNATLQLDTNQVRGFLYPAQAHFHWPTLARKSKIQFPLTQIGNISVSEIVVENPADQPIILQFVPLSYYPSPHVILDLLGHHFPSDLANLVSSLDHAPSFFLPDIASPSPILAMRKDVELTLGVRPHNQSASMIIQGSTTIRIGVAFKPVNEIPHTSLILLRNNLTLLEAVVVQGQGGRGELRFSSRKPGSSIPLQFELTEKHLKNCDTKRSSSRTIPPHFTVRRTFTARNSGQLPLFVRDFSINGNPCEGYGFRVLECTPFELMPNTTRKVDIVFTPDFTMSRIRRTLSLHTSLESSAVNFTLQASVPAHMLTRCAASLPRPPWEPILYYSTLCLMVFLLFCVVVAGYFEADRIFTADIHMWRARNCFDKAKVFDLKSLAGVRLDSDGPPLVILKTRNGHYDNVTTETEQSPPKGGLFLIRFLSSLWSRKDDGKSRSNGKPWAVWNGLCVLGSLLSSVFKRPPKQTTTPSTATKPEPSPQRKNSIDKIKKNIGLTLDEVSASLDEDVKKDGKRLKTKKYRQQEDASSTTTDTSSLEAEDPKVRDTTPEQPPKAKKQKHSGKGRKKSLAPAAAEAAAAVAAENAAAAEDEFQITSKSKSHKNIKVDPKTAYGGNILEPSSLELPYTTKLEASREADLKVTPVHDKPLRLKTKKKSGQASALPSLKSGASPWRQTDSPPPAWATSSPDQLVPDGDLSQISLMTQQFAKSNVSPASSTSSTSLKSLDRIPTPPGTQGASYSAVASGNDNKRRTTHDNKPRPNSATLSTSSLKTSTNVTTSEPHTWSKKGQDNSFGIQVPLDTLPPALVTPPPAPSSPFGQTTIDALAASHMASGNPYGPEELAALVGFNTQGANLTSSQTALLSAMIGFDHPPPIDSTPRETFMQKLQADRRKRHLDYHQQRKGQAQGQEDKWPFYEPNSTPNEALWDATTSTWSTLTNSPPKQRASELWVGSPTPRVGPPPLNPAPGSSTTSPPRPPSADWSQMSTNIWATDRPLLNTPTSSSVEPTAGAFDPFNTLGSIWNPSAASGATSNGTGWTTFPDEDKLN